MIATKILGMGSAVEVAAQKEHQLMDGGIELLESPASCSVLADFRALDVAQPEPEELEDDQASCLPTLMFWITVIVLLPIGVCCIAAFFGLLLALVEGWSFGEGFYYVCGALTSTSLTSVTPSTGLGKAADIVVSIWSLSLSGLFV